MYSVEAGLQLFIVHQYNVKVLKAKGLQEDGDQLT